MHGAIWWAGLAFATSFYPRPFPEAVSDSPLILRGTTGDSTADWGLARDGTRRIYTYTDLTVTDVIKGELRVDRIAIRELGGEKDGVGLQVSGTAQFTRGEDIVVLLGERNADSSYDAKGMMMSKLNVVRVDGEERLDGPILGAHTHPGLRGHEGEVAQAAGEGGKVWTIEAVRTLVREQEARRGLADPEAPVRGDAIEPSRTAPSQPAVTAKRTESPTPSQSAPASVEPRNPEGNHPLRRPLIITLGILLGGAAWMAGRALKKKR